MFKRIKVITLLITVLLALGAMQLISAGVFIGALNNDKQNMKKVTMLSESRDVRDIPVDTLQTVLYTSMAKFHLKK